MPLARQGCLRRHSCERLRPVCPSCRLRPGLVESWPERAKSGEKKTTVMVKSVTYAAIPFRSNFVKKSARSNRPSAPSPSSKSSSTSIPSSASLPSSCSSSSASGISIKAGPLPLRSFLALAAASSLRVRSLLPLAELDDLEGALLWRFEWALLLPAAGRFLPGMIGTV